MTKSHFVFQESEEGCTKQTPLAYSIGNKEITRLLLENGADVNGFADDPRNFAPLLRATSMGDAESVQLLLDRKAMVNVVHWGQTVTTPLLSALQLSHLPWPEQMENMREYEQLAKRTRFELVKLLLDHGCDVNSSNKSIPAPLSVCAKTGDVEVMRLLLTAGAHVNGDQNPSSDAQPQNTWATGWDERPKVWKAPVFEAILAKEAGALIVLLQWGADVDSSRNAEEDTAIDFAVSVGSYNCAAVLLDAGSVLSSGVRAAIFQRCNKAENSELKSKNLKDAIEGQGNHTADSVAGEMSKWTISSDFENQEHRNSGSDVDSVDLDSGDNDNGGDENDSLATFSDASDNEGNNPDEQFGLSFLACKLEQVQSLKMQVRSMLRTTQGLFTPLIVSKLPLPMSLRDYLLCWDLQPASYQPSVE